MRRRHLLGALAGAGLTGIASRARAEPVTTVIVADLPVGAAGAILRVLQPFLEQALDQEVVLDFRPGAGGIVGLTAGARAAPDGATLTLLSPAVTLAPWLSQRMDCTPADFAPVGQISFLPAVLAVSAASPYKTLADLLAERSRRTELAVPAPGDWSPPQMAQALFTAQAGLSVHQVGGATAGEQLLDGDVDFACLPLSSATDPDFASRLRFLAVSSAARDPSLPAVPSLLEAGVQIRVGAWHTLAVPAGTPEPQRQRLANILQSILKNEAARADLRRAGVSQAWLPGPEAQSAILAEYRQAGGLFAALGLAVRRELAALQGR